MSYKKIIFLLILGAGFLALIIRNFSTPQSSTSSNTTFVIGTAAGYAPYVSINAAGDYEGFDIDVARELAQRMNKELVIKDLGSMTSLMMALEQGSIDAIIWGISITQARQQKFTLIHYQGDPVTSYPLIFWKRIPSGITSLADMKGMTVCVEPSSSQYDVLKKYPDITILPTEKVDDALLHIQYGTATAALLDPAIAAKFKAKFSEIEILDVGLPAQEQSQGVGIVLAKNNAALESIVSKTVATLKQEGIITRLEKKWNLV